MSSEIFENISTENSNLLCQELSLGLKLVYFDENDQEMETEYRKLSSFSVVKED